MNPTKKPAKRRQKKTVRYHVKNWAAYDHALQQRGSLTVWLSEDALAQWKYTGEQHRGGQIVYSDLAIETSLTLRAVYHLPLRQTEGLMRSLTTVLSVTVAIPDHTTLSRRGAFLSIALPSRQAPVVDLVVDSTGVKVYGEGEWKVRQHGASKRRTWRKLHLAVDVVTGDILAETLTEHGVDDAHEVPALVEQVTPVIVRFGGDGAYDKHKVYDTLCDRGQQQHRPIDITIPPRQDAKIWQHGNCQAPPHPRDENLRYIRQHGRTTWKRDSGYHRRSLAETAVFRYKRIVGEKLASRTLETQRTEARIGCKILNQMTRLGMPISFQVIA